MEKIPINLDEKIDFSFHKEERLCSKKIIDSLFNKGSSFLVYPLKVQFIETNVAAKYPVQAAFTVSKKIFKKAVTRNLIKRWMREAYRINKLILYTNLGEKQVAVFFIFIGKEIADFKQVEIAMKKALKKLSKLNAPKNERNS